MLIIRRLPWNIKYIRIRCRAPVQLATLMGREYHFIKERERLRGCARHCAGMAVDENHYFYTYGQYLQVEERKTVFRSGVLECVHYSIYNWVEKSGFQVEKYKRNM